MIHSLITKTGIVWAIGVLFALFVAGVVLVECNALGLGGWTFSQRVLELDRDHPSWVRPPIAILLTFLCILPGHLLQIPRVHRDGDSLVFMGILTVLVVAALWSGSNLWRQ
jgi:hypothetical protein